MARVSTFFDLVQSQFDKETYEKIQNLWKEAHAYNKCPIVIKSGKREGEVCGKGCVDGKDTCLCHIPRESIEKTECRYVLISGKNKGNECKRMCMSGELCAYHTKTTETKSIQKNKCSFAMEKGSRKGEPCGKSCESEYCAKHQVSSLSSEQGKPKKRK